MRPLIRPAHGAFALFFFLTGISLFFFRGALETSNELEMAHTTVGIVENGTFAFDEPIAGQEFGAHGMGVSLAGIPALLIEKYLRGRQFLESRDITLFPLTNVILFAILGVILSSMLEDERRWGATGLLLTASPLLAESTGFGDALLSAVGLAGFAAILWKDSHRDEEVPIGMASLIGAVLFPLIGILSDFWQAPCIVLIAFWGWRIGAHRKLLSAAIIGVAVGAALTGWQNYALRANIFSGGREASAFTTPVLVGLYGLLFSPERGLLIFFPPIAVLIFGWSWIPPRERPLATLATALMIFSILFHGVFWAWSGGESAGPRLLLPCIAIAIPSIVSLGLQWRRLPSWLQTSLFAAIAWSIALAFVYAQYSPIEWAKKLFPFHLQENESLFLPQLSLWQAWLAGVPLPHAGAELSYRAHLVFLTASLCLVLLPLYALLLPFRGYVGTDPAARDELDRWANPPALHRPWRDHLLRPSIPVLAFLCIWLSSLLSLVTGPRGWTASGFGSSIPYMMLDGSTGNYQGWLDYPLAGPVRLSVSANAVYKVTVDGRIVLEQGDPGPSRSMTAEVPLTRGEHELDVDVLPRDDGSTPSFNLYWSWPGGGRYLEPLGGEYISPRLLSSAEGFFTSIARKKWIILGAILALQLLIRIAPDQKAGREDY